MELAKWTMSHNILLKGRLALARLAAARGEVSAAFEHLDEAEKISIEGAELAGAQRARLWLALSSNNQQFLDLARQWAQNRALVEFGREPRLVEWMVSLALARLILKEQDLLPVHAPDPEVENLLKWLERQERAMQARGWAQWEIRLRLLECAARQSIGDGPGALAALRRTLKLAAPGGYVRLFVEEGEPLRRLLAGMENEAGWLNAYLRKLLAAFPDASGYKGQPASTGEKLIEPLTEREAAVLQLISQGLSNQEIAEKLVVTLNTVKKHNNSIFGKLGVTSRAQAIIRARQLGMGD